MKLFFRTKLNATVTDTGLGLTNPPSYDKTIQYDCYRGNVTTGITGTTDTIYFADSKYTLKLFTTLSAPTFTFNQATKYGDNGDVTVINNGTFSPGDPNTIVPSGLGFNDYTGKYHFTTAGYAKTSQDFYYLSDTLSLSMGPVTDGTLRTYTYQSGIITITPYTSITDDFIFFTNFPNTATKYITIPRNPNGTYTFDFSSAATFTRGVYYFEQAYGYTSLPFIFEPAPLPDGPIWRLENALPLSGLAISLAETETPLGPYSMDYFDYSAIFNGSKGKALIDLSKTSINFIRIPFSYTNYGSSGNVNGLFNVVTDFKTFTVNTTYANAFIPYLKTFVDAHPNIVFMLDAHDYGQWPNQSNVSANHINLTPDQISSVWLNIVNTFKNYNFDLSQYPRIFFEIENEPYACDRFDNSVGTGSYNYAQYYQPVITTLRNYGYPNKIVMGGGQTSGLGKFTQPYSSRSFKDYTAAFPVDSNLAITLHNYFDEGGSGTNYPDQLTLAETQAQFPSTTVTTCMNILKPHNIDLIYGEFGFQTPNAGYQNNLASYGYVLDLMKSYVDTNQSLQKGTQIDLLKSNGNFLGFSGWDILGDPTDTEEHGITKQTMTDFYSNYMSV